MATRKVIPMTRMRIKLASELMVIAALKSALTEMNMHSEIKTMSLILHGKIPVDCIVVTNENISCNSMKQISAVEPLLGHLTVSFYYRD